MLAAQRRLEILRRQRREERAAVGLPVLTDENGRLIIENGCPSQNAPAPKALSPNDALPAHLGWGSETVTAVIRAIQQQQATYQERVEAQKLSWLHTLAGEDETAGSATQPKPEERALPADQATVCLYPDVALAMLRRGTAAPGRIWLLLRTLDANGSGWVEMSEARANLTTVGSPLHICSWRQLRNLLAQGEGIFWQQDDRHYGGRLWLRSVAKVAAAHEVWRLTNRPVALPIELLTKSIGTVRAHFYASFHSGRNQETATNGIHGTPIARQTLKTMSHLTRHTQRAYERRVNVQRQQNFAIGEPITKDWEQSSAGQEHAWQHAQAGFCLTDYQGKQGKPGTTYLAWQLPNTYIGPHRQQLRNCQKRINQTLADLYRQGIAGNSEATVEDEKRYRRRFYSNGQLAAKAYNRSADRDIYWHSAGSRRNGRYQLWYHLPAQQ